MIQVAKIRISYPQRLVSLRAWKRLDGLSVLVDIGLERRLRVAHQAANLFERRAVVGPNLMLHPPFAQLRHRYLEYRSDFFFRIHTQ